ncbi:MULTISPECIES: ATP-binding protein [Streptomyces]|uniref:ATP-binding protein n=2 Tax=Streptomyces rimosus subsp. rimosus TaxID=132474 RepID=L8EVY8_STRR1|nr:MULTISPECIES: ATP-binding protein [Streptomyces]MYT48286.1 ATP-binding protein [Streptomyces sp. SID5471]QDA05913.1 ATP-binding protein [Streptomyces rimosus]QEV77188.1 ATP-binding protein [Streptomyces rimosus]QGY65137.1 ATP-binding protein [Streptomyces rimosus R6-500]QST82070.1 ATP-binding protein [Streptomyces rimosus subsp. rimosus ATCC 10970]
MYFNHRTSRPEWSSNFIAKPEVVPDLRRLVRARLETWGLAEIEDTAELCVSELITNVIHHVGSGTPVTLSVTLSAAHLRIEVRDPLRERLPVLLSSVGFSETGRGLGLVGAMADRWGVVPTATGKTTWCEIASLVDAPCDGACCPELSKAEALLTLYDCVPSQGTALNGRLRVAASEEAAIALIVDLLYWLRAHGRDPEEVLDRAQMHFEGRLGGVAQWS